MFKDKTIALIDDNSLHLLYLLQNRIFCQRFSPFSFVKSRTSFYDGQYSCFNGADSLAGNPYSLG